MDQHEPGGNDCGHLGLIEVIAHAAVAGWAEKTPHRAPADRWIGRRGSVMAVGVAIFDRTCRSLPFFP